MVLLFSLLLAHFIADYPLQNGWIVQLKFQKPWGVFVHTLIHAICTTFLLLPFWGNISFLWIVLTVFISHSIIDHAKVMLDRRKPTCRFILYFVDQFLHLGILTFLFFIFKDLPFQVPEWGKTFWTPVILSYFITLVVATYALDITLWIFSSRQVQKPYVRNYSRMLVSALFVTLGFVIFLTLR